MKYLISILILFILLPETVTAQGQLKPAPEPPVPGIGEVCWSVTSYWPFKLVDYATQEKVNFYTIPHDAIVDGLEQGKWSWVAVPFGGQANEEPTRTGDGTFIDPLVANWSLVAGPIHTYWMSFHFPWGVSLIQHDTFGAKAYQDGVFWHSYYNQYVIGVDVLSFEPVHYLECDGVIR